MNKLQTDDKNQSQMQSTEAKTPSQTKSGPKVRPTKRQKELLEYIKSFIEQHGYSPSYREIMTGVGYTSVATVALHIGNLIKRGHLKKRNNNARSLEVVEDGMQIVTSSKGAEVTSDWLIDKLEALFTAAETSEVADETQLNELKLVFAALGVLGLDEIMAQFEQRLLKLTQASTDV